MKYITHHRFKCVSMNGAKINIPYGTELELKKGFVIAPDGTPICYPTSENAHLHFSRNDDENGLERGALTYAIAYSARNAGKGFRFTNQEIDIITKYWSHFLRPDSEYILFNQSFFDADVQELRALASALNIKPKRR